MKITKEWLTVSEVKEKTGLDVQRIRRMVDNNLVGEKKNGVRMIHIDEVKMVEKVAEFMNTTPNATYDMAREELLKDTLLEEHKREQELSVTEQAMQNMMLKFVGVLSEQIGEQNKEIAELRKLVSEGFKASQLLLESEEMKKQQEVILRQEEIILQTQEHARKQKELYEQSQEKIGKLNNELEETKGNLEKKIEKLAEELEEAKQTKEEPRKKKKFWGLF
jgi:hypothetical protein